MNGRVSLDRTRLGALSVALGPMLMSIGDLFHPAESWDPAVQVAILAEGAPRWYLAHLLLFIGMLLFIPGVLALTELAAGRKPVAAYAARVLMLVSVGGMSAVFAFEMLLGSFISHGADQATAVALLESFQATQVFAPILPSLLAFFVGTGVLVWSLMPLSPSARWPALLFALGAALILGEIILAQVTLSQIGNILILTAGIGFARLLLRGHDAYPPPDRELLPLQ